MPELELPKLADTRSTQRMLNLLAQLEDHMANRAALGSSETEPTTTVTNLQVEGEIARLRAQNKQLKLLYKQALERVDALITNLQHAPQTSQNESMAA